MVLLPGLFISEVKALPEQARGIMHLFETKDGDKWVCITCGVEEEAMIKEQQWQWCFDKDDLTLRCALCGHPDYDYED